MAQSLRSQKSTTQLFVSFTTVGVPPIVEALTEAVMYVLNQVIRSLPAKHCCRIDEEITKTVVLGVSLLLELTGQFVICLTQFPC